MTRELPPSGCAVLLAIAALGTPGPAQDAVQDKTRLRPVAIEAVELGGVFWGPRLETHRLVTIPHTLDQLESHGHVTNFDKAAGDLEGPFRGNHAYDSDLYKGVEGAVYSLFRRDDPVLRARVDDIVRRILRGQEEDGYLGTYFTLVKPDARFTNLRTWHELYCGGHFLEMAVAYHRLSGSRDALAAARRLADHLDEVFGPGKRYEVPGHQELELALIKLYRATGEPRYLALSRFFLDERGHAHGSEREPFVAEDAPTPEELEAMARRLGVPERFASHFVRNGRMQDHEPLARQHEARGHAVRAGYTYCAMTDVVGLADAPELHESLRHLWKDIVDRKMYLTGGVGTAQHHDEGFGDPFLLPNDRAYSETCAGIAFVLWQHRMNLLEGHAKYADVMELALYNAVLAGVSLAGDAVFYRNPLSSQGGAERSGWIVPACCPTNVARLIPQVAALQYAEADGRLCVNLYAGGEARVRLGDTAVTVRQETGYPWDGGVTLRLAPERPVEFALCLRVPVWARGRPTAGDLYSYADAAEAPPIVKLNGRSVTATVDSEDGYLHLTRLWQPGDTVELTLPMPIRRVVADERVEACRGKLALMRGPLVYCFEAVDHPGVDVQGLSLPASSELRAEFRPDVLGGVTVLRGTVLDAEGREVALTAVPYHAWSNRQKGAMTVWVDRD